MANELVLCERQSDGTTASCVSLQDNFVMLGTPPSAGWESGFSLVLVAFLGGFTISALKRVFFNQT